MTTECATIVVPTHQRVGRDHIYGRSFSMELENTR